MSGIVFIFWVDLSKVLLCSTLTFSLEVLCYVEYPWSDRCVVLLTCRVVLKTRRNVRVVWIVFQNTRISLSIFLLRVRVTLFTCLLPIVLFIFWVLSAMLAIQVWTIRALTWFYRICPWLSLWLDLTLSWVFGVLLARCSTLRSHSMRVMLWPLIILIIVQSFLKNLFLLWNLIDFILKLFNLFAHEVLALCGNINFP